MRTMGLFFFDRSGNSIEDAMDCALKISPTQKSWINQLIHQVA